MRHALATALVFPLLLAGCVGRGPVVDDPQLTRFREPVELAETPFFPQDDYQCGPAALATVLTQAGIAVSPQQLVSRVWLPARGGSLQAELVAAARSYDLVPYPVAPEPAALLRELVAGRPVLVLQNLGFRIYPVWHYAVVIGYLPQRGVFVLRSGTDRRLEMPSAEFLRSWRLADQWGLVLLRPGELPAADDPAGYLMAVAGLEAVGRVAPARVAYAAATERWPRQAHAWLGLGNASYAAGDLAAAEAAYRTARVLAPDDPIVLNNLAETLAARGCNAAARALIDTALRLPGLTAQLHTLLQQTAAELRAGTAAGGGDAATCAEPARPTSR